MTDKAEVDRAIAALIAEQRAHGATAEDIAVMVKLMSGDDQESDDTIPDDAPKR